MGITSGYFSLGDDINKVGGRDMSDDTKLGVFGEYLPELSLDMSDEDLIKLTDKWQKKWDTSAIKATWLKQVDENENYWRGKQFYKIEQSEQLRPLVDNIVWQSVETYLPAATKQNPEPLVELRSTEQQTEANLKYAELIRNRLADWTDDVKLRLKLKKTGRNWLLSLVGVAKMGWDITNNRPACKIIRPRKLIFDSDGVTDEDGYSGKYVGEYRKLEASTLIALIEKEKDSAKAVAYVKEQVKQELGTDIQFIEWWTNEYTCWTLDKVVLLKKKNLHWNWEPEEAEPTLSPIQPDDIESPSDIGEGGDMPQVPDEGEESPVPPETPQPKAITGPNHFPSPRMPYIFLSIFNLGKTPVDETSLITQILPQQDKINKREKQIDRNVDGMNGGVVVSEERSGLTKDEAKGVTTALRMGGTVVVPTGAANEAVYRMPSVGLPADVFGDLNNTVNRVYDLFGVKGITPGGIQKEDTVRGKIITKGLDTDRIGGGITEYFEQFADDIYNYVVQLMYVYDDIFVQNAAARPPKLKISVKEGSLLPKDATTKANQAIELSSAGKMSLIDLYKALEYSDPEKMAANVWLEANAPELLFKDDPRIAQAMQLVMQKQAAIAQAAAPAPEAPKGPSESISFKDMPPEGAAQMAAQAGIRLSPQHIEAHQEQQSKQRIEEKKSTQKPKTLLGSVSTE